MTKKVKKLSKKIIFAIVCGAIIGTICLTLLGMQIAFMVADNIECWLPDYEKADLSPVLEKSELDEDDYALLYRQTGLTRLGVDRMLAKSGGKKRILTLQEEFFTYHEVKNDFFAPFVCTDFIEDHITNVYLEDGDIIVTSSTHLSGWRMGHAGLVVNSNLGTVLQANAIGSSSKLGRVGDFTDRVNFMILSPKVDSAKKSEVVAYATENLIGIPYGPTVGVFGSKNSINKTQCAHVVWYAYNQFGIDLDSNGGLVVTPKNIANSPYVELVQVFGFDPNKLW